MKRFHLRSDPSQISFLFKRTLSLIVIAASAAVVGFGGTDIEQPDGRDIRKLIKQGEKHVRRGELELAEKQIVYVRPIRHTTFT